MKFKIISIYTLDQYIWNIKVENFKAFYKKLYKT